MAVHRYERGGKVFLTIHSDVNHDLALFLIFLGVVATVPSFYIINKLFIHALDWDWRLGGFVGLGLVMFGLFLLVFTRKSFRLGDGEIVVKDGLFRRPLTFHWHETPKIRMRAVEEERGGRPTDVYELHLVDGRYNYFLDRRPRRQLEARALAEHLARIIKCPFIEKGLDSGDLIRQPDELDLSFQERARRYPQLRGLPPNPEVPATIKREQSKRGLLLTWRSFNRNMFSELLVGCALILSLNFLPFKSSALGVPPQSLFDLMRASQGWSPLFYQLGGMALLILMAAGVRHEFCLEPDRITWRQLMWGLPVRKVSIPTQHLEQVMVRESARGAFVQLISDRVILTRRLVDEPTAVWLSRTIRYHYGPAE